MEVTVIFLAVVLGVTLAVEGAAVAAALGSGCLVSDVHAAKLEAKLTVSPTASNFFIEVNPPHICCRLFFMTPLHSAY
ncbi:hypothetical protein D3C73_1000230 [compost metagenome]